MAHYSYESYQEQETSKGTQRSSVSYFALTNDGDETVVRFNYATPQDLEITTVHTVKIGDRYRRVSCLRTPYEPVDNCPLCAAGEKPASKIFVKLIEYVRGDDGTITPVAKVWERPASFARLLRSYFDEYGNLSECIFKIKRHGKKGDLTTTYDVIFANPAIYKPEIYVKDFSAFENYSLSSYVVLEKTYDELKAIQNGTYVEPVQPKQQPSTPAPQPAAQPAPTYQYQQYNQTAPQYQSTATSTGVNPPVQPAPQVQSVPTPVQQPQEEFINKGPRRYTY